MYKTTRYVCLTLAVTLVSLFFAFGAAAQDVETVTIRAWTVGPDAAAYYRAENLVLAADRLNRMLEDSGANIRVEVDADFESDDWAPFRRRIILAMEGGDPNVIPDIINSSHLDIPVWADAGWLAPLDDYIDRYWDKTYQDIFPHLWDAMTYQDQRYAVPQDIEVRMVYYRADHLRSLGWSEADIEDLPRKVREREFLLDDLIDLGAQMQDAGLVEWGIIHRPSAGPDFFQFKVAHGGEYFDPETGKLVLDREPMLQTLEFFHRLTQVDRITPPGMTGWPWPTVHQSTAVDGSVGMNITGGMWNWAEYQFEFGVPEEELWENIIFTLIPAAGPAGTPNQLGHPLAYMVTEQSQNKELASLLITLATDVDLNTNHSLEGAKLAIRQSQTAFAPFAAAEFLVETSSLLPAQIFLPSHPGAGFYNMVFFETIGGIQTGALTPEQGLQQMEQRLQRELGDDLIVR